MAELLGPGLSCFGGFMFPPEDMASRVKARLADGLLPAWCELLESCLMNSSKCVAVIPPAT